MSRSESWLGSDKYFVSGNLNVYSVDLSSEPLKVVPAAGHVKYDGPTSGKFKKFLLEHDFRVNRRGEAIVRVPKPKTEDEFNFFLLEKLVPLRDYDFTGAPPPSHRPNSEQLRLMKAITDSMKKEFVDVGDLESPPANGNPISVEEFLEKLNRLLRKKEVRAPNVRPGLKVSKLKRDDWEGFFRRMNRTFVNKAGNYYIKFDFRCVRGPGSGWNTPHFYGKNCYAYAPIETVQFDENSRASEIRPGNVSYDYKRIKYDDEKSVSCSGARLIPEFLNVDDCVFLAKEFYCFGKMTKVDNATFRNNVSVTKFFQQSLPFADRCFVDDKGTTFFVFSEKNNWYMIRDGSAGVPRLIK